MEIKYSCPKCGTEFEISEDLFDVEVQCSVCQNIFKVQCPTQGKNSILKKAKNFCKQYKKWLMIASSVTVIAMIFLIFPSTVIKNLRHMPEFCVQITAYCGTPMQRAKAFSNLAVRSIVKNKKHTKESDDYYKKAEEILNDLEEDATVLTMKINAKYRGDYIKSGTSPEADRLVKLNKMYIFQYVSAHYAAEKKGQKCIPAAKRRELLLELEKYLLEKIKKEGMLPNYTVLLGLLYFDNPDFPPNLAKAEYYFKENFHTYYLIQCYALQGKIAEAEAAANEFTDNESDLMHIATIAYTMTEIYCSSLMYRGKIAKTPKNYEKAMKWRNITKNANPALMVDMLIEKAFPK